MLTFIEAIESLEEGETPSILLANGFSQAWDSGIFNYANLLDAANFDSRDAVLRALFANLDTYDFETVMQQLVAAEAVITAYGTNPSLITQIRNDQVILKEALITAISNTHPELPGNVTDAQYIAVRQFLSQFKEIFTLNYDLLLYWARNKNDFPPVHWRTDDGFRAHRRWKGYETDQEVYFLHGGLHIYDTKTDIKKHAYTEDGETIIEQVRENLENGRFPLFVSEPSHEKKKTKIEHNPYLSFCYRALINMNGVLFIYGHSIDENDKHIFDQIKLSRISKVFVSIYGDENNAANTRTKANALAFMQTPTTSVEFYQAESTPVWA